MKFICEPKDIVADCIINQIVPTHDKYTNFDIYIRDDGFKIKYNHHYYMVKVTLQDEQFYFHLKPFAKSYYTTLVDNPNSFDMVIHAIKEHDLKYQKPVKK